jgi:hypothetical protein
LTHRREDNTKIEQREIWRHWPWRLEWCSYKLVATRDAWGKEFFLSVWRESMNLQTPWFPCIETKFGFLASRTMRELISVVLNHQVCGYLLQQQPHWGVF